MKPAALLILIVLAACGADGAPEPVEGGPTANPDSVRVIGGL